MNHAMTRRLPAEGSTALEGDAFAHFPAILREAGSAACFAADEFFAVRIRNANTRRAYDRCVREFLAWCEARELTLEQVSPGVADPYIDGLRESATGQRQALAALRQFFDALVTRHAVSLNPFLDVRVPPRETHRSNKPEITVEQARQLLASINTSRSIGLRDRAVLGTLTYTGARVGAVAQLRLQDLRDYGPYRALAFREKRGADREIPVRIDLDGWLTEYLEAAGIRDDPKGSPLFRRNDWHTETRLGSEGIGPWTIRNILKRRLKDAGLPTIFTPHSFRVLVVSALLDQGVPVDDVQYLAGHARPAITRAYDRSARRVTRNIVERIPI